MSNHIIHGRVVFICDVCEDDLETDEVDFSAANNVRREEGWTAFKDADDEWAHRCPDCKGFK